MKIYWSLVLVIAAVKIIVTIKVKSGNNEPSNNIVYGKCLPMGPLSSTFASKLRLPGFPFEFPPILPGSHDRYLIFPAPDTLADFEASSRRCKVFNGKLVDLQTPVEMEILACALETPSFIGSWDEATRNSGCMVLYPGGVISISENNCMGQFGSICKVPGSKILEGFQL